MNVINYQTGNQIGIATSIDEVKYTHHLGADNTGTGAVKAGDWISEKELADLGISADLTVYFE